MDALEANNRELSRALTPAEKLEQALEMMAVGIELKRAFFRQRFPALSESEIEERLAAWLMSDG